MARGNPNRIDRKKEVFWIRTMQQWEASGESARAYCVGQGLKETQFHWWKRVLQERGKWRPGEFAAAAPHSLEHPSVPFAAVELRESHPGEISQAQEAGPWDVALELSVAERYQIRIPAGFDRDTLEGVLSVLDRRGC